MLSFFKSSKKRTQKKGGSFYHRENIILTTEELEKLFDQYNSESIVKTNTQIQIQGNNLDNITTKNIKTLFGEESFITEENDDFIDNHSIYFYRYTSQQLRFLTQIHFSNNEFFLAATKVYADHILSDKEKQDVFNRLKNKYCPDNKNIKKEFNIEDKLGNLLSTYDDMYFYIRYIPNNKTIFSIKNHLKEFSKKDTEMNADNELDKLI